MISPDSNFDSDRFVLESQKRRKDPGPKKSSWKLQRPSPFEITKIKPIIETGHSSLSNLHNLFGKYGPTEDLLLSRFIENNFPNIVWEDILRDIYNNVQEPNSKVMRTAGITFEYLSYLSILDVLSGTGLIVTDPTTTDYLFSRGEVRRNIHPDGVILNEKAQQLIGLVEYKLNPDHEANTIWRQTQKMRDFKLNNAGHKFNFFPKPTVIDSQNNMIVQDLLVANNLQNFLLVPNNRSTNILVANDTNIIPTPFYSHFVSSLASALVTDMESQTSQLPRSFYLQSR